MNEFLHKIFLSNYIYSLYRGLWHTDHNLETGFDECSVCHRPRWWNADQL